MATNLNLEAALLTAQTLVDTSWMGFDAASMEGAYGLYTQKVPGGGATILEFDFITALPVMEKLAGARVYDYMRAYQHTIRADTYVLTFALNRKWVQYDKSGLIAQAISGAMDRVKAAYDKSVATLFDSASGAGPTGFDGVALFSASHPHGSGGNQSNIGAGTNLSSANLSAAEYAGMLWTDEKGEPTHTKFTTIRTGPKLKRRVLELLSQDRLVAVSNTGAEAASGVVAVAGRSNVFSGEYVPVVDERVSTFYWDLIDTTKAAKPMVLLDLMAPQPEPSRAQMNDPMVWDQDMIPFGGKGDWGVGAGHWHTCYRGTGTA